MKPIKLLCLVLALMFIAFGCEKKPANIHEAVAAGNIDQVRLLFSKGAHFKTNALHVASEFGQKDVAELLISKAANINAKGYDSRTPLWWARNRGHKEIVELLRNHGAKE